MIKLDSKLAMYDMQVSVEYGGFTADVIVKVFASSIETSEWDYDADIVSNRKFMGHETDQLTVSMCDSSVHLTDEFRALAVETLGASDEFKNKVLSQIERMF